jgi:pilus assembly protein CpaC
VKLHILGNEWMTASPLAGAAMTLVTAILMAVMPAVAQDGRVPPMASASIIDAASAPGALASVSRAASSSKILHVTVGHSIFIDTKTRLHRIFVADPAILNSVTLTPTEIIVTAMNPGISSLTLLDEVGQAQSYVVSSDLDIDGLRNAMAQEMRGDSVRVDGSGGRVTLSGTVATDAISDSAVKLASLYSKEVANALTVTPNHPKQVRLQVRILEVDRSKALQLGINLFNPGGNTSFLAGTTTSQYPSNMTFSGSGNGGNLGGGSLTTSNPLNFMLYSAKLNLGTTIQDLETKQVLQVLAEPTITTISGEKADFLSGGEFPFPVVQPGNGPNSTPVVTISFRPYGVKVEFTPVVNEDGTIRLKVAPEVSALDYTNAVTISGFTVPALSTRRAATEVELRSEQSFAISGLLDQRTTDMLNKDPGAASIPILGYLFKSKNSKTSTTELVIVVTPTVVDPLVELATPSQPDLPVPLLNAPKYDKDLGRDHNPQPAAPPITPDHPPIVPPVFLNSKPASTPAPAPAAALNVTPAVTTAPQLQQRVVVAPSNPATSVVSPPAPTPPPVAVPTVATPVRPAEVPSSTAAMPAKSVATLAPPAPEPIRPAPAPPARPFASTSPTVPAPAVQPSKSEQSIRPYVIEVMTLSHESDAEVMIAALNRRGYNVSVSHDPQNSLLHLDIGPFANTKDAETMRQRLLLDGYDATIK